MYGSNSLFDDTTFVINLVLQLILLIIFLRLAWNVSKIKKEISPGSHKAMMDHGKRFEFKGKKDEAIDCYLDALFNAKNDQVSNEKGPKISEAIKALKKLNAKIPDGFANYE